MGRATRLAGGSLFALFVSALVVRPLVSSPAVAAGLGSPVALALLPLVAVSLLVVVLRLRSGDPGAESGRSPVDEREGGLWDARTVGDDPPSGGAGRTDEPAVPGGQTGSRDRGVDIEDEPPDARLGEHLTHLRAALDDDLAEDLHTLEAVAAETDDGRDVPARCPQQHCDAVWSGRTVLGVGAGRYERLDDSRVQCLACETVTRLDGHDD
jgi:hypothetical protein